MVLLELGEIRSENPVAASSLFCNLVVRLGDTNFLADFVVESSIGSRIILILRSSVSVIANFFLSRVLLLEPLAVPGLDFDKCTL